MPTDANAYNSRLTSEALEKRFRDTFRAQGGAELVDDLYASGVIVPVVDFTQSAEGSQLPQSLQEAWDFTTGAAQALSTDVLAINNAGFWRCQGTATLAAGAATGIFVRVYIDDGVTEKNIWALVDETSASDRPHTQSFSFNVFLRSGDQLRIQSNAGQNIIDIFYRQIADVNGNLVNPSGFTFS